MPTPRPLALAKRTLDARPDTVDFRDRMYEPTLVEVPEYIDLRQYRKWRVPVLDQRGEGACTGFGLATVANCLLRRRAVRPDRTAVSPRMFYEMAKRYDEWPGEAYEGSSARGAMKGWHKHGVCAETLWHYDSQRPDRTLTDHRVKDAARRPLGAYYRVNHKDLAAIHTALAEVGILLATATVHEGWDRPGSDGTIKRRTRIQGGHAFAIVAYDQRGFWIQNSWGAGWGAGGFGLLSYDDWLAHGTDVWVARLGAPVSFGTAEGAAASRSAAAGHPERYAFPEVRPHVISIGNDGTLSPVGTYGTAAADVEEIFTKDLPRLTAGWSKKRILLYAHGGLVDEKAAVQRIADYRSALLDAQVYPLAFVWRTDYWTTLRNILEDALSRRRPEGPLEAAKDFMLDRLDDGLEPLARALTGKATWDEMKENALLATTGSQGGARLALSHLAVLAKVDPSVEIHVAAHSAGSIFHAALIQRLASSGLIPAGPLQGESGLGLRIASCTLWAPACTIALFKETYLPAIREGRIGRITLFTLTDEAEQDDDCANVYHKSLLYLVSNAFEARTRIPLVRPAGEPLLGMEKFVRADTTLTRLIRDGRIDWVRAPNTEPEGSADAARARHHVDFDDDPATLRATLARILRARAAAGPFTMSKSAAALRQRRRELVT